MKGKMTPQQKLELKAQKAALKAQTRAWKTDDAIKRQNATVKSLEKTIKANNTRITGKTLKYDFKKARLQNAVDLAKEAGKTARVSAIATAAKDAQVGTAMAKWNSLISNNATTNSSNQTKDTSGNTTNNNPGGYVV